MDRNTIDQKSKTSRHTWIGEEAPDWSEDSTSGRDKRRGNQEVSRQTGAYPRDAQDRKTGAIERPAGTDRRTYPEVVGPGGTRVVDRQRRKYQGFITDEELNGDSRIIRPEDRKTRVIEKIEDRDTRVYGGFGMGGDKTEAEDTRKKSKVHTFKVTDDKKFKRLIAILAVFVLLLAFEISYAVMKSQAAKLPARTEAVKAQTEEIAADNKKIEKENAEYGDYEEIKELNDSWLRLQEKLKPSE